VTHRITGLGMLGGEMAKFLRLGARIINQDCIRQCVKEGSDDYEVRILFTGGAKHTLIGHDARKFWEYIETQSENID
jgi:hypothetical protein